MQYRTDRSLSGIALIIFAKDAQSGAFKIVLCSDQARHFFCQQLRIICERQGVHFLDAKDCEFNQVDFMHLTRKGHAQLAELLAKEVPGLI